MIEPPLVFVFGPYIRYSDGKPGTVMPRWACGPPAHASRSVRPRAVISIGNMKSVGLEAGAVDDAVDLVAVDAGRRRCAAIGSVTSSTFARASAGRKCELNRTRLQPNV